MTHRACLVSLHRADSFSAHGKIAELIHLKTGKGQLVNIHCRGFRCLQIMLLFYFIKQNHAVSVGNVLNKTVTLSNTSRKYHIYILVHKVALNNLPKLFNGIAPSIE